MTEQRSSSYEENQNNTICKYLGGIRSVCPKFREAGNDTSCKICIRNQILHRAESERGSRSPIDISERYGYIYLTANEINGKLYIGQHKAKEFDPHYKGSGYMLRLAFPKYGWENFKCDILEWCDSKEELDAREKEWISAFSACESEEFYNIARGGTGGDTLSALTGDRREEVLKHCSEGLIELWKTEEFRKKVKEGSEAY